MSADWKSWVKKAWRFLWDDDSLLSWIANIIVAFILIKFILYPGLGFVFQTGHPVVAVVSESMEHGTMPVCPSGQISFGRAILLPRCSNSDAAQFEICGRTLDEPGHLSFDEYWKQCGGWYDRYGIEQEQFDEFSFSNGFRKGDIMFLYGTEPSEVVIGDVIVFMSKSGKPIIHRVVNVTGSGEEVVFSTKGDRNPGFIVQSDLDERAVTTDMYIGRAVFRVPLLGYVKIAFTELIYWVLSVV